MMICFAIVTVLFVAVGIWATLLKNKDDKHEINIIPVPGTRFT